MERPKSLPGLAIAGRIDGSCAHIGPFCRSVDSAHAIGQLKCSSFTSAAAPVVYAAGCLLTFAESWSSEVLNFATSESMSVFTLAATATSPAVFKSCCTFFSIS